MKTVSADMLAKLAENAYTLAVCWLITCTNGTTVGFTDWPEPITYGGQTYATTSGFSRSAISQKSDLSVPNLELTGLLDDGVILNSDIQAGLYDYASYWVFTLDPTEAPDFDSGVIKLRAGVFGQITATEGEYTVELRGLAQLLDQTMLELYVLDCQVDFCGTQCGLSAATYTHDGTVGTVTNSGQFTASISGTITNTLVQGVVTWTSGLNNGRSMEVSAWDGTNLTLYLPMGYAVASGDTFTVLEGCDKSYNTCLNVYDNIINHRGFPFIPGLDAMYYPNAALQFPTSD